MSQLKPYPVYKDSGVEWIGEIPGDWNVSKIKYLVKINELTLSNNTEPTTEIQYIDIGSVGSTGKILLKEKMKFENAPSRARRILRKEDTIISTVRTYLRAIATINEAGGNLVGSTGFAVLTPTKKVNSTYLSYLLHTTTYIDQIVSRSTGVSYPAITSTEIGDLECLMPDKFNQDKIVGFLKLHTSQIDALIADKEHLIELLEEKRQAVITEKVTKGLDPNVEMKDSGVEWIGSIPNHWGLIKLKYLTKMKSGESINTNDIRTEGLYKVYGGGGFRGYTSSYTHSGDHILIGRQGALCGNITFASGEFWATEHAITVKQLKSNIEWLRYLLESMNLNQYSISAAQPGLSVNKIINIQVPVPPSEEQKEIAELIKSKDLQIVGLKKNISQQITKLKQYRESLIYEAVTGKIDVRDYAPKQ